MIVIFLDNKTFLSQRLLIILSQHAIWSLLYKIVSKNGDDKNCLI